MCQDVLQIVRCFWRATGRCSGWCHWICLGRKWSEVKIFRHEQSGQPKSVFSGIVDDTRVVLATVPGYPASVWVGTEPNAPVRVRNRQVTRPALSWRVVTRTGHRTVGVWLGWNRPAVPFMRFLQLWLQLSI